MKPATSTKQTVEQPVVRLPGEYRFQIQALNKLGESKAAVMAWMAWSDVYPWC